MMTTIPSRRSSNIPGHFFANETGRSSADYVSQQARETYPNLNLFSTVSCTLTDFYSLRFLLICPPQNLQLEEICLFDLPTLDKRLSFVLVRELSSLSSSSICLQTENEKNVVGSECKTCKTKKI